MNVSPLLRRSLPLALLLLAGCTTLSEADRALLDSANRNAVQAAADSRAALAQSQQATASAQAAASAAADARTAAQQAQSSAAAAQQQAQQASDKADRIYSRGLRK